MNCCPDHPAPPDKHWLACLPATFEASLPCVGPGLRLRRRAPSLVPSLALHATPFMASYFRCPTYLGDLSFPGHVPAAAAYKTSPDTSCRYISVKNRSIQLRMNMLIQR